MFGRDLLPITTILVHLLYCLANALTEEGIPGVRVMHGIYGNLEFGLFIFLFPQWPPDQYNREPYLTISKRCKQNSTVTAGNSNRIAGMIKKIINFH